MTEKRFKVYKVIGSFGEWSIEDTVDDKIVFGSIMHKYEADRLCDKLNELEKENDYLTRLVKAYQKSVEDYKYQIRKAVDEELSMVELADNCGIDIE